MAFSPRHLAAAAAIVVSLAGAAQGAAVGEKAPDFGPGTWINRDATTLSGLEGHVVLLEFWQTW